MAAPLLKALQHYKVERYGDALKVLQPTLAQTRALPLDVLLLVAQCHAKTGNFAQAADYYSRAADMGGPKREMIAALAANMLKQADDSRQALVMARKAARSGAFDAQAEATYRSALHDYLCLDEALMDDQHMLDRLRAGDPRYCAVEQPFNHIGWCADESMNARQTHMHHATPFTAQSRAARHAYPHTYGDKIRVGYLSGDFSDSHPTTRLMQGMLSLHDRDAFDITLFCNTDDEKIAKDSGFRSRHKELTPIRHLSDADAAALIRSREIDILIDLTGHTKDSRIGVVNRGCAPVQAAYLGFPGSGNGIDCDYIIGDATVTPVSSRPHYHEKFCLMPDSYQVNDRIFRPLPPRPARASLGLPQDKIVFSSFNAVRKITPATATLWAQILRRTGDSVLWMMCQDRFARENFSRWMENAGIDPQRILFAGAIDHVAHSARLQAADIGLDTFPYNGHTTTADILWAGVPVVTYRGTHFASRVSESLLRAIGLPELVADDADGYVDLCVRLAADPMEIQRLKQTIAARRLTAPLFDPERFVRNFEKGLRIMVERARQGLPADHFEVV